MLAHICRLGRSTSRAMSSFGWSTVDPGSLCAASPGIGQNLVNGTWSSLPTLRNVLDPLNGEAFLQIPDTKVADLAPFEISLSSCPKAGLHNPLHNPDRYILYGDLCIATAIKLRDPKIAEFFAKLIQRVAPKHIAQARGEVTTVRKWLEAFGGDAVRQLGRSFAVPGDCSGQETRGYRWPYGQVVVITPFNFPLEIPTLQFLSALFMGNRVLLKVAIVMEQFIRLLIECGMPAQDVDYIYADGFTTNTLMMRTTPRMTLFTGSQHVAEKLCRDMQGRIKLEDAGFDWKIFGPDVSDMDYVAWQSDQDAYAFSGQKCSAQSIVFLHENWAKAGIIKKMADRASMRNLTDLSIGPVLSVTNDTMSKHVARLLEIPGAKLEFGGGPLQTPNTIPECYGSFQPTAIYIPLAAASDIKHYDVVTTEIFGPIQVVVEYSDCELDQVLDFCERMDANLTAGIVSNNQVFVQKVLGATVNGTTYTGIKGRTTGAPANHWFGPAGDPRAGGIHTIEAIQQTWSCHREVIVDIVVPEEWTAPPPT